MTERSIAHGTFVVERNLPVPPHRVFAAWADPKTKQKWFGSPDPGKPGDLFDFRVGGREYSASMMGEQNYEFDLRYYDIVPDCRIVYAYDMLIDGRRISVSVAAIELVARAGGTRMTVTEHGAFLDGLDTVEQRRSGTEFLMDRLVAEVERQSSGA